MGEGLDVGTLTGRIELEDRLSNVLDQVGGAIGKFEDGWKHAGATVLENAASFFTAEAALHAVEGALHLGVEAIESLTTEGAKVADVEDNFKHLMDTTGRLGETLLGALREGTHNTISDFELMRAANQDLAAGLNLTDAQFKTLADGAFALAQATGTDVKTAFETMNDAMLTGRTRALAMLTGTIDLSKAEEDYAKKIGQRVETLTEEEKLLAKREAILRAVGDATKRLGEQTDGLDEKIAQARTVWDNFTEELGKTVATSPVLLTAFDDIKAAISEAFGGSQENAVRMVADAIDEAAITALKFAETGADVAGIVGTEWEAAKVVFKDLEQIISGDVLVFKYLAEGVAEVGKLLHLPGAAEEVDRIDNEIQHLMETMVERGKSIQDDKNAQEQWAVVTGQVGEKIAAIREHMEQVKAAQKEHEEQTKNNTEATKQFGGATGDASGQMDKLGTTTRMTKDEAKKYAEALQEMASVGGKWKDTLATIDGETVEAIKYYLDAGVSLDKLATAYGLTETQAKAVEQAWKDGTETLKAQIKAAEELGDAWTTYYNELKDLTDTDLEKANRASEQKYEAHIKMLQDMGIADEKYYDDAYKLYQADVQKDEQALIAKDTRSKAYLEQKLAQEKSTFDMMQRNSDQYTAADIANQGKIVANLQAMKDGWGQINAVIDKQTEMVRTLSGEVLTLKEYEARQSQGGSFNVNIGNFGAALLGLGLQDSPTAELLAKKGYSFQQIVEMLRAGITLQQAQQAANGSGPRIPGFATGGVGDFGDGTLAMLHGKEAIVPLDKAQGALGNITLNFQVNGTAVQAAQQIKDIILRELQTRRQFGL